MFPIEKNITPKSRAQIQRDYRAKIKADPKKYAAACVRDNTRMQTYGPQYRAANGDQVRANTNARRARDRQNKPEVVKASVRKECLAKYGITPAEYDALLIQQSMCCAICKADAPGLNRTNFCVDHDHITGKVRGLLCNNCNRGLGFFNDAIDRLISAVAYMERYA